MDIILLLLIVLILVSVLFLYWIYRIIRMYISGRYKAGLIHTFVLIVLGFGILWELRIIPLSVTNDFKNRTEALTGKQFWSQKEYRLEDISVRGEGYTFEIYRINPEMTRYFENPPKSFFENYPTKNYSLTKWQKTPIQQNEIEKLEFLTPVYMNWSKKQRTEIAEKHALVKEIANREGSYYVLDTIIGKDATLYLIAPKERLIIWINHNM